MISQDFLNGKRWMDKNWKGECTVKAAIENGAWTVELAIPWKTLGYGRRSRARRWASSSCATMPCAASIPSGRRPAATVTPAPCCPRAGHPRRLTMFHAPSRFGVLTLQCTTDWNLTAARSCRISSPRADGRLRNVSAALMTLLGIWLSLTPASPALAGGDLAIPTAMRGGSSTRTTTGPNCSCISERRRFRARNNRCNTFKLGRRKTACWRPPRRRREGKEARRISLLCRRKNSPSRRWTIETCRRGLSWITARRAGG